MDRIVNVGVWCAALVYLGVRVGASQAAGVDAAWDAFLAVLVGLVVLGHVVEPTAGAQAVPEESAGKPA